MWYVPDISRNLFSISQTIKRGFKFQESKDECSLLRDDRVRLKRVRAVHGLYALEMRVLYPKVCVASADQSLQLWHERLCHQNKAHVNDILRKYQIKGDAKDSQICDGCCYGKQSRRPFGTRKQRATTPGELINIDVCGPMQQQSLGGAKYYVCFKDDFTKYRRVFFMQSKNEVSECLETFLNEAKNTGHMIKEVLSDGGGEVINSTVKSLLEKSGISSRIYGNSEEEPLQTPEADVEKEMEKISCNAEDTEETLVQQSSRNLRDRSILKMPAKFDSFVLLAEHIEPETYKEAMASEDSDKWLAAMKEELESLSNNNTWILSLSSIAVQNMRCYIAIFLAVLSTAWGQTFYVVAPNTLRLDSDETIAIALEGKPVALVTTYIQDHPGKIKNLTKINLDVNSAAPEIFKVHVRSEDLPSSFLSTLGEKSVLLTVHSDNFHKEILIPVSNKTGYVFIQTDKPIYTPNQLVHIRIIPLNEDALPSNKPIKLQIKNPNGTTMEETTFIKGKSSKFQTAFARHMYKFPNFPYIGEWTVTVNYGYGLDQSTTVHFELQEYVLPTFTVELKTPEIILESDKDIVFSVNAQYVYGEKVKGTVSYRLGVKGEAPQVTYFAVVGPPKTLIDGFHQQVVSTNEFARQEDIGWFPEIEGSHLVVEATVMEDTTGNKEVAKDANGRFSKTPFIISFKRCLQDFKPGLMSVFEADINYINGKPAAKIPTRISATADGQPLEITVPTSISDDEGKVTFEIQPERHHNTISIKLETEDPRHVGQQATGHFLQHRFQSSTKAFIALDRSSVHRKKVGDKFGKIVHVDPSTMNNVYYAVITKGKIVQMVKLRDGDFKIKVIEFSITQDMVPSFRLVVWAIYEDELLVDSLNIDIDDTCPPEAEVFIEPKFEAAEPGRTGFIHYTGKKSTLFGISGIDTAVYALSEKDVLTRAKIFKAMAKHDLGCGPGGGITTETVLGNSGILIASNKYTPKPGESSCVAIKRRKRAIASEILSKYEGSDNLCCALGLNKDRYNRNCETRTNILTRYFEGKHENCSRIFLECCLYGKEHGFTDMKLMRTGMNLARMGGASADDIKFFSEDEEDVFEQDATVRRDFRETIFFEDFELGADGTKDFQVSLPHSITTWVFQAVSVSSSHGICVSEPKLIVSKRRIFLQLNLPYSVVRNEQVEIQATLFNYGFNKIRSLSRESRHEKSEHGKKQKIPAETTETEHSSKTSFPSDKPMREHVKEIRVSVYGSDYCYSISFKGQLGEDKAQNYV
ncbi:complement C3 [Trichonephila clavata]|uniref:Complement C3 n=1 Tax=Trichonephila clavata TaxID=2740835 RepID=A0A8X6M3F9_TRICU|nr:complement C3 [Trichonephila clavata]